ncbi:hypothetical protein COS74_04400 [bacterium CG06_land_8_20_14_3_00_33_50]|nr:MAG: hypothetical protein COS74_04400 [bacterium CG06_land_8_20_14_3_00_33_50]
MDINSSFIYRLYRLRLINGFWRKGDIANSFYAFITITGYAGILAVCGIIAFITCIFFGLFPQKLEVSVAQLVLILGGIIQLVHIQTNIKRFQTGQ